MSSDSVEEWQVVRRGKGASRKFRSHHQIPSVCLQEQLDVEKLVRRIRDTVSDLRAEEIWQQWKNQLLVSTSLSRPSDSIKTEGQQDKDTEATVRQQLECVCYGLGSFSSCVSARYQLAMLLLLLDAGHIPLKDCSLYDPAFSVTEKDILRELGLTVLTENEEGKRLATKPTLFYLMHCGKALYNNLLWQNWNPHCLSLVTIIGNCFSGIRERTFERELKRDYSYINKAVDLCEERLLPCPSRLIDVFSDTAIITFSSDRLNKLPSSTWTDSPEPQYQHCSDLEIILKQTSVLDSRETSLS
ncbi:SRR1-like protein isoform X1 [Xiphophorus couchianus]|uniref:SRR1-like protein isoform X1 n=1 Tax=Xiphophorus couchianus TaxID=32473 RepID=UPI001016FC13|nr:SRR1-like protein isoform X1 [Xiphophorus couchianus]